MTFFKNRTVFFFDLFGFLKPSFQSRRNKQVGKITKAIGTLNIINEDISVKNMKDDARIEKMKIDKCDRNLVREQNIILSHKLSDAL